MASSALVIEGICFCWCLKLTYCLCSEVPSSPLSHTGACSSLYTVTLQLTLLFCGGASLLVQPEVDGRSFACLWEKYHCTSSPFALDNKMSLCRQQYTEGMERGKELMQFVSYPSSAESQWLAQFAPYHLPNSQHCLKPTTTSYCHSSGNLSSCDISVCALHYAIQQLCN